MTTEQAPDSPIFRRVAGTLLVLLLAYGALALAGVVR